MSSKQKKNMKKALDNHTKMSTEFSKANDEEKMKFIEEKTAKLRMKGDFSGAKDLENCVMQEKRITEEAMAESQCMIQESYINKMTQIQEPPRTDDGDQTLVYGDSSQKLKVMWASGMDWNPSNPGNSRWLVICACGDYDELKRIVKETPTNQIKELIERRETLLNYSAIFHIIRGAAMLDSTETKLNATYGHVEHRCVPQHINCLLKLIKLGANVNARDFAGFTPLHICVTRDGNDITLKMAKILLNNGANVNARNRLGESALIQPLMSKELHFIKLLLDYGIDPTMKDNTGCSAISMNVYDKDINMLFVQACKKDAKKQRSAAKGSEGSLKCEVCGEPSKSRCTGCYVTRYCGRECQKAHWSSHKKECKENKKRFLPVALIDHVNLNFINIGWSQGAKVTSKIDKEQPTKTNFIVKVQVQVHLPGNPTSPEGIVKPDNNQVVGMPLMVYNEKRSVQGNIVSHDPLYEPLCKKIQEEGVYGIKGYFYALLDKDSILRINVNDIQPPRDW